MTQTDASDLELKLDQFAADFIVEYRRVTWRTTWLCVGIVAVFNTILVIGLMVMD